MMENIDRIEVIRGPGGTIWGSDAVNGIINIVNKSAHDRVPTAICMWPKDLVIAPREWAERFYNVHQYSSQKRGGHFPAWEAPDAYAHDVRLFERSLNIS
jgi:outer membrane receptor for Fe3+-dicitrate